MTQLKQRKFSSLGPMAIRPEALDIFWPESDSPAEMPVEDGVATVVVRGPLTQHRSYWCDSYEEIMSRVQSAAASEAHTVLLKIHSPGGDAYGAFETSRAIRAICKAANKKLVSYVDGEACSAGYALAAAATDGVYLPESAIAGSVGVINTLVSVAKQDAMLGLDVVLVTSGARKADGNPHNQISEATIAANQEIVDAMAGVFFRWVGEARGISPDAVQSLQAGLFVGQQAVDRGLADAVLSSSDLHTKLRDGTPIANATSVPTDEGSKAMKGKQVLALVEASKFDEAFKVLGASKYSEAVGKLAELVEEGDEDARAALKKMANKGAKDGDDSGDDKDKKEPEGKKAESDGGDKKDDDKKDKEASSAAASSSAASTTLDLAAEIVALKNREAARLEAEERRTLIDSRPDLKSDKSIQAALASASIEQLRFAVKTIPVAKFSAPTEAPAPTRGNAQGDGSRLPESAAKELRIRMGLDKPDVNKVTQEVGLTVFGGSPEQIAERLGSASPRGR